MATHVTYTHVSITRAPGSRASAISMARSTSAETLHTVHITVQMCSDSGEGIRLMLNAPCHSPISTLIFMDCYLRMLLEKSIIFCKLHLSPNDIIVCS